MRALGDHLGTTNLTALAVGLGSLALIIFIPKLFPRIPGSIVALLAATLVAAFFRSSPPRSQ